MKQSSAQFLPLRQWLLLFALPLANLLLLAYLVFHYAIDAPFWDQWYFIPFLDKAYQHQLTFGDFWAQHNEHRLIFPRLIMLVCARASHWNIRWELAINLLLGVGIYGVWVAQIVRTAKSLQDKTLLRLLPIAGLAAFSLRQQANWTWGWQLQIFLNVLAVLGGIALLSPPGLTWGRLVGAMGCGVVATYSFANGLLFWIVGAVILACGETGESGRRANVQRGYWLAWGAAAVPTIVSYLYHFTPMTPGAIPYALRHPLAVLYYVCIYMGSLLSFMTKEPLSAVFGLSGLIVFAVTLRHLVRSQRLAWGVLAPYLGGISYVLLSALVSGMGRAYFGSWQALESRYTTISALFWIGVLMLMRLAMRGELKEAGAKRDYKPVQLAYGLCCLLIVFASVKDTHQFKDHYRVLLSNQQGMLRGEVPVPNLAFDPVFARKMMQTLQQRQLTIYRTP